jgi:ribose transport system permease protein
LLQGAVIGLVSIGQTFVILSGGIDLSLPWTLAGAAVITTVLMQMEGERGIWVIPLVLGLCSLIGLLNGLGIYYLEIPPAIMTLGMNGILLGAIAGLVGGSRGVQGRYGRVATFLGDLSRGNFLNIPNLFWVLLIIAAIITIVLSFSVFGRRLYAVGTNPKAALFSGVNVPRIILVVYMLSALFNGLAGILLAGKVSQAYLGMGDPYLFTSVAAVVIGGASILGGHGHVLGTVGGALLLSVLTATIPVLNLPRAYQLIVYGLVVLLAVYFASSRSIENSI